MIKKLYRFLRRERGSVIIEFALVVPLFFLMLSGIIAFSRAYTRLNALNSSLREGARVGSTLTTANRSVTTVRAAVYNFSSAYGFPIDTTQVAVAFGAYDVQVSVTNYPLFTGITSFWGMTALTVSRNAIFRWEWAP